MRTLNVSFAVISALLISFAASHPASAQDKSTRAGATAAPPSEVALPPWVQKLNLSPQQDQQARTIVRDYDAKVADVWRQFSECYQQTVKIEAVLLTAIEDNLTDTQRKQARDVRRKTAQTEKPSAAGNAEVVPITLTAEQEAAADKINAKYLSRLRLLNRDITSLHNRLVSLEADKIVEIEKILTKPQLQQLSETRQDAPLPPAPTITSDAKPK